MADENKDGVNYHNSVFMVVAAYFELKESIVLIHDNTRLHKAEMTQQTS